MLLPAVPSGAPNPWFRWSYVTDNSEAILAATRQHVILTALAVGFGCLLALPLGLLARRYRRAMTPILTASGVLYTIPSLAFISFLYPLPGFGLQPQTVVVPLVAYSLLILVRNLLAGLDGVPEEVREAARGMGLGPAQLLLRVELPLALPAIVAGIRVATVSTISLVTVGALVGYGGLGDLILTGFNNNFFRAQVTTALIACVALAAAADVLLLGVQRLLTPWQRRRT